MNDTGANALTFGNTATQTAVLKLNGNTATYTALNAGLGTMVIEAGAGGSTLVLNTAGTSTYNGLLADNGGQLNVTKAGAGTLILTGSNTNSGSVTVNSAHPVGQWWNHRRTWE